MIEKNKTREFWDSVADETSLGEKSAVGMLTEGNEYNARLRATSEQKHFLSAFKPTMDMNILEVGSGGGRWAFFLSDKVRSVTGIDFSENMVSLSQRIAQQRRTKNVTFHHCELPEFTTEQSYSIIYFSGVLQYLADDDVIRHIRHASNLLNDTGFIVSRDTIQSKQREVKTGDYPVIYRTIDEYRTLFASAGYNMNYTELSYDSVRFSHFVSRVYRVPFVSYGIARWIHRCLLAANSFLGDPDWLKKAHHKTALKTTGIKEHRFFKYERNKIVA
jgi:SAM-dependent methyltransferase